MAKSSGFDVDACDAAGDTPLVTAIKAHGNKAPKMRGGGNINHCRNNGGGGRAEGGHTNSCGIAASLVKRGAKPQR